MAYRLAINDYDFPATMRPVSAPSEFDLGEQERPRADGSAQQRARAKSRVLTVRGDLSGTDPDDLQATYDALKAACGAGPALLLFGRDDRDICVQMESWIDDTQDGLLYGVSPAIAITFRTTDEPYFYALDPVTVGLSAAGGTVTPEGTASALPSWTITIGTGGTGPLTLVNGATNETAVIGAGKTFASDDVLVLHRDGYQVLLNDAPAAGLVARRIPRLERGANVITLTAGGTAAVAFAGLSATYTPRYS